MAVDDQHRPVEDACVERRRGDLAADAGQPLEPGERRVERQAALEVEREVGRSRPIRRSAATSHSALASAKVTSAIVRRTASGAAAASRAGDPKLLPSRR